MESDLDEDDLDLLEHTLGRANAGGFRRLQRRIDSDEEEDKAVGAKDSMSEDDDEVLGAKRRGQADDLEKLFEEESEEEAAVAHRKPADSEGDDLDDFIEDDVAESGSPTKAHQRRIVRDQAGARTKKKVSGLSRFGPGLSRDVIQDLLDIFGDGTEYADLVDDANLAADLQEQLQLEENEEGAKSRASARSDASAEPIADIPERYVAASMNPLAEGELERETPWVAQRLLPYVQERQQDVTIDRLVPVVGAVLSLIRDQFLEVPFIATHRKEYFQHLLGLSDLWRVLDLDSEWRVLERQRESFATHAIRNGEEVNLSGIDDAGSLELLQEYHKQVVRLGVVGRGRLQPDRGQLLETVRSFCIEPSSFMQNWAMKELRHPAGEPTSDVNVLLLAEAKAYAAAELAFSPTSGRMFRTALEAVACVNVSPTAVGQRDITLTHDLGAYKFLKERPVAAFTDDLWLRLKRAETAGLLTVQLVFRRLPDLESEWSQYYGASGSSQWDAERQAVLHVALHEHLIPRIQRQVAARLQKMAEAYIAQGCQYALQGRLMQGPHVLGLDESLAAISWGDGAPGGATMCVIMDGAGRVREQARFLHLQDSRGRDDWDRLVALLDETQVVFAVVGGTSIRTAELHDRLRDRLYDAGLRDRIRVVYGDDDAARLYPGTAQAQREFPDWGQLLRYCVSLGRRWLCPLYELAALPMEQLSRLPLHPSQSLVPAETLERFITRALVNVTNLVGLDASSLVGSNAWVRSPLPWLAGMGSRVAELLIRRLAGKLPDRRVDLEAPLPGPVTYMNAASFIRFPAPASEPLDTTRIHPENYPLARKIAGDACGLPTDTEEGGKKAVLSAMKTPERLNDLLLEEYARELEARLHVSKHLTLLDIKAELQAPYADLRTVLATTPAETVFEALSGETEASLYLGQHVQARIQRITDRAVLCRLESGLSAVLPLNNMAPQPDSGRPPSHPARAGFRPGQAIVAAVMDIHLGRLEATISMRPDDLKEPRRPRSGDFDPYYDHEAAKQTQRKRRGFTDQEQPVAQAPEALKTNKPVAARRLISHPSYREVSRLEAERLLSEASLGEVIVRPSASLGPDHLALTWKIDSCEQGGLFQHLDILESQRPADNPYALGRRLEISQPDGTKQVFEDLDEIIARYIEPTSAFLQDIRTCPKFRRLNTLDRVAARTQIESMLAAERAKAPARIAYSLWLSRERPGTVVLSYQPSSRCHHELVEVSPMGFRLRGTSFERLDALINWFKANHNRR